jgi:hypothetical protein
MSSIDSSIYGWLATQPAFVEVAIGVAFVVIAAPAALAAVAVASTWLEGVLGVLVAGALNPPSKIKAHPAGRRLRTT